MALRPAKLGVSLFRHPCRKPLSPGKGVNTGIGVPATCLGATPQTPFLDNDRGFSTDWPLPRGEGLCMLSWLCICAIVVVCCRCVLHRLCSTTCMRPCIEHLGIHARHPCRGYITGATAPSPSKDACSRPHKATMQGRIMTAAQSRCTMQRHKQLTLQRCKTSRASNTRHPFL